MDVHYGFDEKNYSRYFRNIKNNYMLVLFSNDILEWSKYLRRMFGYDELFDKIILILDCFLLQSIKK